MSITGASPWFSYGGLRRGSRLRMARRRERLVLTFGKKKKSERKKKKKRRSHIRADSKLRAETSHSLHPDWQQAIAGYFIYFFYLLKDRRTALLRIHAA